MASRSLGPSVEFARLMAEAGWMVITGAGGVDGYQWKLVDPGSQRRVTAISGSSAGCKPAC